MTAPGWAVAISGDLYDLECLKALLPAPGDPWIEPNGDAKDSVLLRSTAWDDLTSEIEVEAQAVLLVERINGGLPITTENPKPIRVGMVYRFDAAGKRSIFMILQGGVLTASAGRVLATLDGIARPAVTGNLRCWLNSATTDPVKAELLTHLSRADNWYDIYKAAEKIRELAGGQAALKQKLELSEDWIEWRRCWQTANFYRHASNLNNRLPQSPANLSSARAVVLRVAGKYL